MIGFFVFIFIVILIVFILGGLGFFKNISIKGKEIIRTKKLTKWMYIIGMPLLFVLFLLIISIKIVPVGHALVVFYIIPKKFSVSGEGLTFIPPFITTTAMYDLRRREYTMTSHPDKAKGEKSSDAIWCPTREGLQVGLDLTCWYRLNHQKVFEIHQKIGPAYDEKVVRPAIRSTVRLTVSEYGIMDIYSFKREEIQKKIFKRIKELLSPDGIIIEGVLLRNVQFSEEFEKAIENKQVAQQEAERMKYILEKEKLEAKRRSIEAEGKAKAIEIVSRKLAKYPSYISYLYVDKLSDKIEVIISDQPTILDLKNIKKK